MAQETYSQPQDGEEPRGLSDAEFEELYSDDATALAYRAAFRIVGNHNDAEEVVQDTYEKAVKHRNDFKGESKATTWLYRIAVNTGITALNRIKKQRSELGREDTVELERLEQYAAGPEPQDYLDEAELYGAMKDKLKPHELEVALLRAQGFSHEEIAEKLGISVSVSKVRLHRGRRRLEQDYDA